MIAAFTFVREALDEYAPATVNLDVNVLADVFNCAMPEERNRVRTKWNQ